MRTLVWLVVLVLALAGCSGGESESVEPTAVSADEAGSVEAAADTVVTTTEAPALVVDVDPLIAGVDEIVALTPSVVDRLRPELAWEPVGGAVEYYLVVLDEIGEPYWVWSGSTSEISVGGASFSERGNGPTIGVGYSWSVSAFDGDGQLIGISGSLPITVS